MPGLGVVAGSSAIDPLRRGTGVDGIVLAFIEASDSGGDGGVALVRNVAGFECGGVDAAVGEERDVTDVAESDTGERGRSESAAMSWEVLRW